MLGLAFLNRCSQLKHAANLSLNSLFWGQSHPWHVIFLQSGTEYIWRVPECWEIKLQKTRAGESHQGFDGEEQILELLTPHSGACCRIHDVPLYCRDCHRGKLKEPFFFKHCQKFWEKIANIWKPELHLLLIKLSLQQTAKWTIEYLPVQSALPRWKAWWKC